MQLSLLTLAVALSSFVVAHGNKAHKTDHPSITGHGCPIPTGHPGWHCKHNGKGKGKGKGHGKHTTTKAWWDGPNNGLVPTSIAAPSYVPEPTGTGRPHCYSTTVSAWEAEETGAAGGVVRVMREKRTVEPCWPKENHVGVVVKTFNWPKLEQRNS